MSLRQGTNTKTKAELLALWSLLKLAKDKHIEALNILGDSKVIIEWERKKYHLQVNQLYGWSTRTTELISNFQHINFQHYYKMYNSIADILSKRGLRVSKGYVYIEETLLGSSHDIRCVKYY